MAALDKLLDLAKPLLATLVAALGSVGFVAFVGAAILWARFATVQLPADQSVTVVPRTELVSVGAAALVSFAVLGAVAVLAVYLIDDRGRPTPGMRFGLLALAAVEIGVAVLRADFEADRLLGLAAGFAAATLALALLPGTLVLALLPKAPARGRRRRRRRTLGLLLLVTVLVVWAAWLVVEESALALVTLAVALLTLLLLVVARATGERFALYGVAIFVSVVVFGAISEFVRNKDTPFVQAAAVLRLDDARGTCGLYVGETADRLYLGRVDLRDGATRTQPAADSGRLFWLAKDELAGWAIGPLQDIDRAQEQAVRLRDELVAERPAPAAARGEAAQAARAPGAEAAPASGAPSAPASDLCAPRARRAAARVTQEEEATLARRFQPILAVDRRDGFWPISVTALYDFRGGAGGRTRTCLKAPGSDCQAVAGPADVPWIGAGDESLEFPAANANTGRQQRMAIRALGSSNPYRSARMYFLATGGKGRRQLTSLQYWFFYPFNYQRLPGPLRGGYHEGDFESVGVLLSRERRPVYVWTARHGNEGERYAFGEPGLQSSGEHPRVVAARGSHATYASCGRQRRPFLIGAIDDVAPCPEDDPYVFEPQATPLVDLAHTPWACFAGRFGHTADSRRALREVGGALVANGPRSPLWQQSFGPREARPCDGVAEPEGRGSGEEESSDDATAQRLRDRAAPLGALFSSCVGWRQRPTLGGYVSVCDAAVLDRFFRAGLADPGPERLRVTSAGGTAATTVPAVLRTRDGDDVDGARISAAASARPVVYVARYTGSRLLAATFRPVAVRRGGELRLRSAGTRRWRLVDARGRTVATATPATLRGDGAAAGPRDLDPGAGSGQ